MKTKKVTRHYCDHCHKGFFKRPAAADHEAGCTLNPQRTCYLCKSVPTSTPTIPDLVRELQSRCPKDGDGPGKATAGDVAWLNLKCSACPACMLSVLRQANVEAFDDFDYRKSVSDWNADESHWTRVF